MYYKHKYRDSRLNRPKSVSLASLARQLHTPAIRPVFANPVTYGSSAAMLSGLTQKFKLVIIGERAKRARHSLVCSIENRGYIIIMYI